MTRRSTSAIRLKEGAKGLGTATVREGRPQMTAAQLAIFRQTGNLPQVSAGFDEIADGLDAPPVATPAYRSNAGSPREAAKKALQALGRLPKGQMNETERRYAAHLEQRKHAGEIEWYRFEGIKFRLAGNTFYTPDFAVMLAGGPMECHEVKGHWQDDARAKIKIAADQYPFKFIAVKANTKKSGGGWAVEEF